MVENTKEGNSLKKIVAYSAFFFSCVLAANPLFQKTHGPAIYVTIHRIIAFRAEYASGLKYEQIESLRRERLESQKSIDDSFPAADELGDYLTQPR